MRDTGLRFVNFLLHFVVVLCLALACRAQSASNIPNTISIQASGAPSGACGNNFVYTNSATNDFYNCVAGAWNKVTGGGGGTGTVTSIATTGPIGGGTITTTGTITCTTCTTATTPTNHGVILGAGSQALGVTAAGTTGQVLTGVTGSDPTFQAATVPTSGVGAPGMILLEEHTASASAELDFTTCITSSYDEYLITALNLVPTTNSVAINLQVHTGGSYDTTAANYIWAYGFSQLSAVATGTAVNGTNYTAPGIGLWIGADLSNDAHYGVSGHWGLASPGSTSVFKQFFDAEAVDKNAAGNVYKIGGGGSYIQAAAVDGFRVLPSSSTLASGTVRCYGLTK